MRILALNFFPAFHPPRSGGEQRYYYFYRHLSEWYDVTLLSPTYSGALAETVEHSTTFREHRIPKDAHFDRLHWTLGSLGIGPECSGYVVALAGALSTAFGRMLDRLVREVDVVVHESPFTLPYDRSIATDGKPRIYNAYNIEHRLAAQFFQGEAGRKAIDFIRFLEHQLVHQSRHLLATSADEAAQFVSDFALDIGKISLAPNGFEPNFETCEQDASAERGHDAVFMGSAHPPNVEAARFIVDRIAPNMPATRFKILGSVCQQLSERVPGNVDLLGYVDDIDKRKLLRTCGVALNPLFSGAGTNLKMLDYMAAAAPIVTTPIGARGLDLSNDLDAFIATGDEIESAIKSVLNDRHRASRVGAAAREKAYAKYTWSHIAEDCRSTFEACMATSGPRFHHARNPGLLVVNDFSVLNPAGGGQVRIYELLTELGRTYDVTLLCLSHKTQAYERALASNVVEVGIPKTAPHRDAEVQAARGETVSIGDVLAGEFVCDNAEFIATFTRLARESVAVIFEHPFLARLLDVTPDSVPIVYSSLNFEQGHKRELLSSRLDAAKRIEQVIDLETKMLNRADLVVCVSESDRDSFRRIFPDQTYVIV
ncbi:MAG TPA: glycosyltransferase, partial [Casimicrobiaceae bacterium]|nr:glycosyltransferase [Casimicrobiaceae bacterium]